MEEEKKEQMPARAGICAIVLLYKILKRCNLRIRKEKGSTMLYIALALTLVVVVSSVLSFGGHPRSDNSCRIFFRVLLTTTFLMVFTSFAAFSSFGDRLSSWTGRSRSQINIACVSAIVLYFVFVVLRGMRRKAEKK